MRKYKVIAILFGLALGAAAGLGAYTFVYAKGYSYMTNNPQACANCHVMEDYYAAWTKGSHRSVAVCNDCHTPSGLVPKYITKASNGFWHSFAFTSGKFPDPLRIKPHNHDITEGACRKCHAELTLTIEGHRPGENETSCIRCHDDVGHMN
jgi:cytochrome c nitrite reductase small subunit